MATESGTEDAGVRVHPVVRELAEDAYSFEFFQAVSLLQRLQGHMRRVGEFGDPADEAVHFRVNPRLAFPASQIQKLDVKETGPQEMMVNFMGLTGPSGVLPYVYSEKILEQMRARDHSMAAFFDIFNHRAISLFYRAWQKSHVPVNYGIDKRDLMTQYLLDLAGLGTTGLRGRQEIEDEALLHYVSLLGMQARSAAALEQILSDYYTVPVEIQQFTGAWYALDPDTQCLMGDAESASRQLGGGAVVGDFVWDRQARVRIRVGPLTLAEYEDFLPGGDAYKTLRAILRFWSNQCLDFELQLVLRRDEVPAIVLDPDGDCPARLGWVSWASTRATEYDPEDTVLAL